MQLGTDEPLVHVQDFQMSFGSTRIIENLSFDVHEGETFGFLGSNGSGKTTTIRSLLGIYQATSGTLHIGGAPFGPEREISLGYLPEERGLYKKEAALDVMVYFGRLKGLAKNKATAWSKDYLERVGIGARAKVRLDKLSSGEQQKVQLGITIMNDPLLLILDEPTKGFDPVNRRLLMEIIEEQRITGTTVLMVTHQMEEVERLCDRVLLLKDGKARAYGTVSQVQDQFGATYIEIGLSGEIPKSNSYRVLRTNSEVTQISANSGVSPATILQELVQAGVPVNSFNEKKTSLDEIFIQIYGDEPTGQVS
ncbi:MAG: ATP-binding cassette domain-containing protein [Actinomycetes bacterium]